MPLIRCKVGPTIQSMGGMGYSFDLDAAGRAVCDVYDETHAECFISAGTYEEVDPLPADFRPGDKAPVREPGAPAPTKSALLSGTALVKMMLDAAIVVLFEDDDGKVYAKNPWPGLITLPTTEEPEEGVLAIGEGRATIDFTVTNGKAGYVLLGTYSDQSLYSLNGGSTFETPPEDEGDEDDDAAAKEKAEADAKALADQAAADAAALAAAVTAPKGLIDIKGIGKGVLPKLADAGITTIAQLLALGTESRAVIDKKFHGAPTRDKWFEQAEELSKPAS